MKRMTRNEYHEYLKKCVNRAYDKNDSYTFENYWNEEIETIPLDLSAYPRIKDETKKHIDKLFDEETTDKNGNYMLRGFHGDNIKRWNHEKEVLGLYCHYGFYYAGCGWNDEEMLLYTFCEGDTTLTLFNNREQYEKQKAETESFFMEN